jgi:hypothetical protein
MRGFFIIPRELIPQPDLERQEKMMGRYEPRDECQVRSVGRVSDAVMQRVRPHLFRALGKAGGIKRAASLPAKQRAQIARTAALARWRRHRAAIKARVDARASGGGA